MQSRKNIYSSRTVTDIYDFISSIQHITQWRSLTEAIGYRFRPNGKTTDRMIAEFESYWRRTHQLILKKVSATRGSFGIDIGCGNGEFLSTARSLGVRTVGITLSPAQADYCRGQGLTVQVASYRDQVFIRANKGKVDFITLIGSIEHFTNPSELAQQQRDNPQNTSLVQESRKSVYIEMFRILRSLLKPGGKVYISCCAFNSVHPTPIQIIRNPVLSLVIDGWDQFHASLLQRALHGYYPDRGMLSDSARSAGFIELEHENGTNDYHQTSEYWWYLIRHAFKTKPLPMIWKSLTFFSRHPYHALITLVNTLTESWPWQFRPRRQGTPVVLERLVFQKPNKD